VRAERPHPLPKQERPDRRPDLERLQGEWQLLRVIDRKGRARTYKAGEIGLRITGQRFLLGLDPFRITIDPTKTPKAMDLAPLSDPEGAGYALTAECIYRIQGNVLTIRLGFLDRPSDFTSPSKKLSPDPDVWIFQRK
jgi:uncharacterized protein (TIGR03067 family)